MEKIEDIETTVTQCQSITSTRADIIDKLFISLIQPFYKIFRQKIANFT